MSCKLGTWFFLIVAALSFAISSRAGAQEAASATVLSYSVNLAYYRVTITMKQEVGAAHKYQVLCKVFGNNNDVIFDDGVNVSPDGQEKGKGWLGGPIHSFAFRVTLSKDMSALSYYFGMKEGPMIVAAVEEKLKLPKSK
jgi:hypothetical protein